MIVLYTRAYLTWRNELALHQWWHDLLCTCACLKWWYELVLNQRLIGMVIWICSAPALDYNGDMNLSLPTLDWNACDVLLTFCVILNWVQSEHLDMWLFSGYRRELALFYEVFLFWFVVTTRVAMSQADLLMTWTWNVEQLNIGCRSCLWLLNLCLKLVMP